MSATEVAPARVYARTPEARARVEAQMAALPAGSPLADYLAAQLEDPCPRPTCAEYIAGLEAELARLRGAK